MTMCITYIAVPRGRTILKPGNLNNESHLFYLSSQLAQNICITFVQRRPSVFDVGPTLYKYHTKVLCLLGYCVLENNSQYRNNKDSALRGKHDISLKIQHQAGFELERQAAAITKRHALTIVSRSSLEIQSSQYMCCKKFAYLLTGCVPS